MHECYLVKFSYYIAEKLNMRRTVPIDLLRGFIMIFMALDHASGMIARVHFFEIWGLEFEGYPHLGWWFTRFISHLCAPGFFFLMGMSIYLFAQKRLQLDWTAKQIQGYFLKRGGLILLFMLFLEFPGWILSASFSNMELDANAGMGVPGQRTGFSIPSTVLYGLGACMLLGAFLWRLNWRWHLGIAVLSFVFSGWYIGQLSPDMAFHPLAVLFYTPATSNLFTVIYPVIPWLGVVTFGMCWAKLMQSLPAKVYQYSLLTGLTFVILALVGRFVGVGNLTMNAYHDWITFFTLVKYPPSLIFILLTCGINLILLFVFSKIASAKWLHPVLIFGQTAMFFYIIHLYVYALMGAAFPKGSSIEIMYGCWVIGLFLLYFICRRFLAFKKQTAANSFWRMV